MVPAIYGTAPRHAAEALTTEGTEVRFAHEMVHQRDPAGSPNARIRHPRYRFHCPHGSSNAGMDQPIEWRVDMGRCTWGCRIGCPPHPPMCWF